MGLGLSIRLPLKGTLKKAAAKELQAFCQVLADSVRDDVMRAFATIEEQSETVYVTLYPGTEPVTVSVEDGWIVLDAKTSGAGPGYHAALVDLLDGVGVASKYPLDWRNEDTCVDETGYGAHRDFARLQGVMLDHFKSLCRIITDPKKAHDGLLHIDWSMDAPRVDGPWAAVSPVGTWTREWFLHASRDENARTAAAEFMIWWNKERDQRDKAKLVATFLWSVCRWRPPIDDREKAFYELVLANADQSGPLLSTYNVSTDDLAEFRLLSRTEPEEAPVPREGGLGIYRGDAAVSVPGGWWFAAPGYMYQDVEDDGGVLLLWHAGRTIRVSTFSPRLPNGKPVSAKQLMQDFADESSKTGKAVRSREGQLLRQYTIIPPNEDEEWFCLSGCAAIDGEVALLTIAFEDAGDDGWAAEVFGTVRISGDLAAGE